jgi:MFS family permease
MFPSKACYIDTSIDTSPLGLLLALPYGTLADTIGKKPVIVLGLLGGILNYGWVMIVCVCSPDLVITAT